MVAQRKRMYRNPVLEFLTLSSPGVMIGFHLLGASLLIYAGTRFAPFIEPRFAVVLFIAGFFSWSLAEYLLHRYVFHFIKDNKLVAAVHFAVHGYHHQEPTDSRRLFMPPVPAAILLSIFWGIFYLAIGPHVWYFLPGFELGYLVYSLVHYSMHTKKAPSALLKPLWKHHALHHYKYPDRCFGVSSRLWDRIFGTMPPRN